MKHIALVSCRKERPADAHTPEEVSKFIRGMLDLMESTVGVFSSIELLRDLKEGTAS